MLPIKDEGEKGKGAHPETEHDLTEAWPVTK